MVLVVVRLPHHLQVAHHPARQALLLVLLPADQVHQAQAALHPAQAAPAQELLQSFAKTVFQLVHPDKPMFVQVVHSHVALVFHLVKQVVELG